MVAIGILLSRITGLARETVFARYFGNSGPADAWAAAYRIPNMLTILFGEGVLSASFVTVYAKLRAKQEDEEAEHVAAAIFGILALVSAALVFLGILTAPWLLFVIAPGLPPDERELTVRLIRILFPATGTLVLSAWCLGVLNSHRRFLLSYTAPVAMNVVSIACLISFGRASSQGQLAAYLAWANILGGVLTFLVQLPQVLQFLPSLRPIIDFSSEQVRTVVRNFGPVFLSKGVVQLSATIDSMIASYLPRGSIADLRYAQIIAILPISLFSTSVSVAELTTFSSATGTQEEVAQLVCTRLLAGLKRIAFFVIPSAAGFLLLGDVISGGLYQGGQFTHSNAVSVWMILAGSAIGLLATAMGRLYSSAFYSLLDTKTPLRFATLRVTLTIALGFVFALLFPKWFGIDPNWGAAGLTASAGIAGWVEFALLRRGLAERIGYVTIPRAYAAKLWTAALLAGLMGFALKMPLGFHYPRITAVVVLSVFGVLYLGGTYAAGVEESHAAVNTIRRRLKF